MKFKTHFIGIKYLKSTGTWRLEFDMFSEDNSIVPELVRDINKILNIEYTEWKDPIENLGLQNLFDDDKIQTLLGTSTAAETMEIIAERTGVDFDNITEAEACSIADKIRSIKED